MVTAILEFWQDRCGLDLRSLAVARVLAGLLTLADVILRGLHLREFYTEAGLLPRPLALQLHPSLSFPSLHIANDTVAYVSLLFVIHGAVGVGLLLGYRTQVCSVLVWVLTMSIQARNPLVLNGGDILFSAILFWGMFLPWGKVWSLDARSTEPPKHCKVFSAATVGLTFQMVTLYFFASLHKLEPAWLQEGSAVYYALSIEHFATPAAEILLRHPELHRWMTWSVLGFELVAGFLLLSTRPVVRTLGVFGCVLLHFGFGAFLELGMFRWFPMIGLLALLPSELWARDKTSVSDEMRKSPVTVMLLLVTALTFAINIDSLGKQKHHLIPNTIREFAPVFASWQSWNVFTGQTLYASGWYGIEIRTKSGAHYDVFRDDKPFSNKKPRYVSRDYPTQRWRKWTMISSSLLKPGPLKQHVLKWWLERWNERHPDDPAEKVQYWYFHEKTYENFRDAPTEKLLLGEYP